MIDAKLKEYGLANSGTNGPLSCDKQQLILGKKMALRDVQNETQNIIRKPLGNPLSKDTGLIADTVKVCGNKRPKLECPTSPTCSQSPCHTIDGANGHLVYARRKAELEQGKMNACDIENSPQSRHTNNDKQGPHGLQNQMWEPMFSCFPAFAPIPMASLTTFSSGGPSVPHSLGKPSNGLKISEPNYLIASSTTGPSSVNPHSPSNLNWKERFLRLQMFLKQCDQSNQEEYIKCLRSLSSAGHSRHAVELEKRAIQLLLEEGKELHRMRVLNVLGKAIPMNHVSPASQVRSLEQVEK